MRRRRFLAMLASGAFGAMTLDVDKLLWVPGRKTIFLPPQRQALSLAGLSFGDMFTIEGVFVVNPVTMKPSKYPQYFMVTDAAAGAFMPYHMDLPRGAKVHGLGQ